MNRWPWMSPPYRSHEHGAVRRAHLLQREPAIGGSRVGLPLEDTRKPRVHATVLSSQTQTRNTCVTQTLLSYTHVLHEHNTISVCTIHMFSPGRSVEIPMIYGFVGNRIGVLSPYVLNIPPRSTKGAFHPVQKLHR